MDRAKIGNRFGNHSSQLWCAVFVFAFISAEIRSWNARLHWMLQCQSHMKFKKKKWWTCKSAIESTCFTLNACARAWKLKVNCHHFLEYKNSYFNYLKFFSVELRLPSKCLVLLRDWVFNSGHTKCMNTMPRSSIKSDVNLIAHRKYIYNIFNAPFKSSRSLYLTGLCVCHENERCVYWIGVYIVKGQNTHYMHGARAREEDRKESCGKEKAHTPKQNDLIHSTIYGNGAKVSTSFHVCKYCKQSP